MDKFLAVNSLPTSSTPSDSRRPLLPNIQQREGSLGGSSADMAIAFACSGILARPQSWLAATSIGSLSDVFTVRSLSYVLPLHSASIYTNLSMAARQCES